MVSLSSVCEARAPATMTWFAETPVMVKGSPRVRLFWVRVPSCPVRAQDVDPGQFLDGHQLGDDGLLLGQKPRPDGHGDREDRRHGHRYGRHGEDQGELQGGENRVAVEDGDDDDH